MVDYLIVGAGLTGMLAARELVDAGASVVVVEQGEVGRESSWAGGGILSPLFPWRYPEAVSRLALWSLAHYPDLARELTEESGIDPECIFSGMLMPAAGQREQAQRWAKQFGVVVEQAADVRAIEPRLGFEQEGVWMPGVGQVRNPRILQALHAALLRKGVVFHLYTSVNSLLVVDGCVRGVVTSQGELRAGAVIVAGGAWSPQLLSAAEGVEVEPVKGQMLLIKAEPGWLNRIILTDSCYLIPRRDGHILVGSTMEYAGFDKGTTEAACRQLYRAALALVPGLAHFPLVKQWAGLRPSSPRGVPFIGESPFTKNLFISVGHFRNGVAMGPASARLLGDLILGRSPIIDPQPYRISRDCDRIHNLIHSVS